MEEGQIKNKMSPTSDKEHQKNVEPINKMQ